MPKGGLTPPQRHLTRGGHIAYGAGDEKTAGGGGEHVDSHPRLLLQTSVGSVRSHR